MKEQIPIHEPRKVREKSTGLEWISFYLPESKEWVTMRFDLDFDGAAGVWSRSEFLMRFVAL